MKYLAAVALAPLLLAQTARAADPPVPAGAHPRLFLNDATLAALKANAAQKGTAAASLVSQCDDAIAQPPKDRGGADGDAWPGTALRCGFAYLVTKKDSYLTAALQYWHAALDDDQTLGDHAGCVQGVDTNWEKNWDGNYPPPPALVTVSHDTGYPMRWYGPFLSLAYDWLYNAPGVDEALRAQTRTCLTVWMDYYSKQGYLHDVPAMNYNAGFVIAKTLAGIAIGTDGAADGHLWKETINDTFGRVLIGNGTTWTSDGSSSNVIGGLLGIDETVLGKPVGPLVGGDWGSWQYGPLSVIEYAAATTALEQNGAPMPAMDRWVNSLVVRYIHGTVPQLDAQYMGSGDFDSDQVYQEPTANTLDAVLLGPSSDQAAAWALSMKQTQQVSNGYIWNALAETRSVTPADYRTQTPAPPLWYLARGTRTLYARSSWEKDALWGAFASPPSILDHQHLSASSFVFSRGGDHLIVDPAPYGGYTSWESNAVTADSSVVIGDYAPSQATWSEAELVWARGTDDAVYAARSDFATAFNFADKPSDISYAHREWVMLPEGEIVTVDRVRTSAPSRNMYVTFHTNTGGGKLTLDSGVAVGTVGNSRVAIHPVLLSGGTPTITQPSTKDCTLSCSYPCAQCDVARYPVDKYSVKVPGSWAVAIHVIDGLAASEAPAEIGSLNDDTFDPAPKLNAGVVGAAVYRASKQSYVVASSARDGVSAATMTYAVPGKSAGRHVVYDAPEAADTTSSVTAAAKDGRCLVTITAGQGGGFKGHPLLFTVADVSSGCALAESTAVAPGESPTDGGIAPDGGRGIDPGQGGGSSDGGGSSGGGKGCGCSTAETAPNEPFFGLFALGMLVFFRRPRRRFAAMLVPLVALGACSNSKQAPNPNDSSSGGSGGHAGSGATTSQDASVVTHGTARVSISPTTATLAAGGTQAFSATVTGVKDPGVVWSATGGQITSEGVFTAPSTAGGYAVRATSVADPTASAVALVTVTNGSAVLEPFYNTPYVQVMTPMPGATYFAPATIRVWVHAPTPDGYAARIDFYLGTTKVGSVARSDQVDYYELMLTGITAGSYEISARNEDGLESLHIPISVVDVPAHTGPTRTLTSDIVLSGNDSLEILGTPDARALITSSNGSHIRSASGWTGHLTIRNADIIGLGAMDDASIQVTATGTSTLEISNSVFDRCGPLALTANDRAPVILRGNTFQPNTLTPVNSEADYAGSHPSITVDGSSSAAKFFQGNNVGVSFVRFATNHWLVGGDKDTDGNVFLGVRAGMEFNNSEDNTLRGNFSYHRYPYGWSQGHNLDFEGTSTGPSVVEHNVFRGSSWMIQSMNGDFRYNLLVDNINEAFFRYTDQGARLHHNVIINVGYQRAYLPSDGLYYLGDKTTFYNNTVDVGGTRLGWVDYPFIHPSSQGSARNNVFTGFAYQTKAPVFAAPDSENPGQWTEADYNCFYNPDTKNLTRYGSSGFGAHDCGGAAGSADPKFSQSRLVPFPFADGDIWARRVTVSQILSFYRGMYTPLSDSPLIDSGDPKDDTGGIRNTDIGAVGAGNPHPDDKFGTFGK